MALEVANGTFACNTGTGAQSVSTLSFQPKVVIFWGSYQTATGYAASHVGWFGAATSSTTERAISWRSEDNVGTMNTGRRTRNDASINMDLSSAGTQAAEARADFTSMNANGFTINWSDAPASAVICHYLALGGTDITNVLVGDFLMSAGTGSKPVTGVGFQPDVVIFFTCNSDLNNVEEYNLSGVGFATDASHEAALFGRDRDALTPSECATSQRTDRCHISIAATSDAYDYEAELTTMDSDGFTLNVTAGSPNAAKPNNYIAIQGGKHYVGADTQRTSTGTKATTGVGFAPKGMFLQSWGRAASASIDAANDYKTSRFAATAGAEGGVWFSSDDAAATSATDQRTVTDKALGMSTQPTTTDAEADLSTLDSDGFTLDWTTADATAREFIFWAFGDSVPPPSDAPEVLRTLTSPLRW